ncbi:MAG: hypothetical protein IPP01_06200 [Saprospiraceae bacterium]|nr:hypothetical protein [Saprospiraceae bacterium]
MKTTKSAFKPQTSTVWHFQWMEKGQSPSLTINPGEIAGFEKYFKHSPMTLSSYYLGVSGTQRFESADWLNRQANKQGLVQYVTQFQLELTCPFKHRINGVDDDNQPTTEYELTKATAALKQQLACAWSQAVLSCENFDREEKTSLLTEATKDINSFLPISSHLFSKAVERMPPEFQAARAIIFPSIPLAHEEWRDKPVKMIAFKKEAIISIKPMWRM